MRISFILTMASAIFLTAYLIYIHTYICYGQHINYFNHQNFKNQHGITGAQSTQNNPNSFFSKNLTQEGNNGKTPNSQLANFQQLLNSQNLISQPEPQFNLPQSSPLQQPVPQMHIQHQPILQSSNMHTHPPVTIPYNSQLTPNGPPMELPQMLNLQNYNVLQPPTVRPSQQVTYQKPTQASLPMQYSSLSTNQPQLAPSPSPIIPTFSGASNYIQQNPPNLGTQSCMTPMNTPITVIETPQNMYNQIPGGLGPIISKPIYSSFYPGLDPNQNAMIGFNQNGAIFEHQHDPASSGYLPLLQVTSPQFGVPPSYPMNTVVTPNYNQGSQSSSLKTLLPIILNLLKEKSNCNCPCRSCNCECKKKRMNNPQVTGGYSKQKQYPLSEEGPEIEAFSEELETIRNVREPNKAGKLKNTIPDVSEESHNESLEYNEHVDDEEE